MRDLHMHAMLAMAKFDLKLGDFQPGNTAVQAMAVMVLARMKMINRPVILIGPPSPYLYLCSINGINARYEQLSEIKSYSKTHFLMYLRDLHDLTPYEQAYCEDNGIYTYVSTRDYLMPATSVKTREALASTLRAEILSEAIRKGYQLEWDELLCSAQTYGFKVTYALRPLNVTSRQPEEISRAVQYFSEFWGKIEVNVTEVDVTRPGSMGDLDKPAVLTGYVDPGRTVLLTPSGIMTLSQPPHESDVPYVADQSTTIEEMKEVEQMECWGAPERQTPEVLVEQLTWGDVAERDRPGYPEPLGMHVMVNALIPKIPEVAALPEDIIRTIRDRHLEEIEWTGTWPIENKDLGGEVQMTEGKVSRRCTLGDVPIRFFDKYKVPDIELVNASGVLLVECLTGSTVKKEEVYLRHRIIVGLPDTIKVANIRITQELPAALEDHYDEERAPSIIAREKGLVFYEVYLGRLAGYLFWVNVMTDVKWVSSRAFVKSGNAGPAVMKCPTGYYSSDLGTLDQGVISLKRSYPQLRSEFIRDYVLVTSTPHVPGRYVPPLTMT
jgi:hypothetical protein